MKLITAIYQSDDGKKIFNSPTAYDDCRRYEVDVKLASMKLRMANVNYQEHDNSEELNNIFPRRHFGKHITGTVHNLQEHQDFFNYIAIVHNDPIGIQEEQKKIPTFPAEMHVLLYKASKHLHIDVVPKEIAVGIIKGKEPKVEMAPIFASEMRQGHPSKLRKRAELHEWNGEKHTLQQWAAIKGMSQSGFSRRVQRMGFVAAMEEPVQNCGLRRLQNPDMLPA